MKKLYEKLARALSRNAGIRLFRFFGRRGGGEFAAPARGVELRIVGERDLLTLCPDPAFDLAENKVRESVSRGDLCIAAFERDRVVAYCWLAFGAVPHLDGVWVDFDSRAAWIYKSFVLPRYRGRGIAPAIYHAAHEIGRGRGRDRSLICVETHNTPSVSAARNANFEGSGFAAYGLFGSGLVTWYSKSARNAAVRFYLPRA